MLSRTPLLFHCNSCFSECYVNPSVCLSATFFAPYRTVEFFGNLFIRAGRPATRHQSAVYHRLEHSLRYNTTTRQVITRSWLLPADGYCFGARQVWACPFVCLWVCPQNGRFTSSTDHNVTFLTAGSLCLPSHAACYCCCG